MDFLKVWRWLAQLGLLGLLVLCVLWNGWLSPDQQVPRSIEIAILAIPLLFFVRGILSGKRASYVAVTLVSLPYSLIGIWYIFSVDEKLYGYLMLLLSLCLFFGGLMYARELDSRDKRTEKRVAKER